MVILLVAVNPFHGNYSSVKLSISEYCEVCMSIDLMYLARWR